jgi:phosphate transport system substrate-binding protein
VPKRLLGVAIAAVLVIGIAACGSSSDSFTRSSAASSPLSGAGTRLIVPLMSKWEAGYEHESDGKVGYRTVGNGVDIGPVASGAADFSVSDAPVTPTQFIEGRGLIMMIPWAVTGMAVVYNVEDAPSGLKLSGTVLGDILLGKITTWDDPAIGRMNPDTPLPDTPITVVHRSDESAEDYVLTNYLSVTSKRFRSKFGIISRQISLPAGIGVKKKGGVSAAIARTNGAIGYVALPYAHANGLEIARMENRAGNFSKPNAKSLAAGAEAGVRLGPNKEVWLKKLPRGAKDAYPLVTFSYAVVPVETKKAAELKRLLAYAVSPAGQSFGPALHFAPLPKKIAALDRRAIATIGG